MSIYKDLKKAFGATVDMIAEKTSLQAQKNRLLTVMKNEENAANRAYIALGKYLYTTMRDGMPEDVEQLCRIIDNAKENMTRAQELYRQVIIQDKETTSQNATEVRENFRKVREPIATGAAATAAKAGAFVKTTAKDTASKAGTIKAAAVERAEDIKHKIQSEKEAAEAAEAAESAESASIEIPEEIDETYTGESEPTPEEIYAIPEDAPAAFVPPVISVESAAAEESAPMDAVPIEPIAPPIAPVEPIAPAAPTEPAEFSPIDNIESAIPEKPITINPSMRRAQRLQNIIRKRGSENDTQD